MTDVGRHYQDSTKLMARVRIHVKYGPPGRSWSLADAGLIEAGAHILDIGCGPGRFWAANAATLPAGLELTLADLSPGMIEEALRNVRAVKGSWSRVTGETADVCALPYPDSAFDVVTAMHMLYHATDTSLAVWEIARVLRADGTLIVTTNGQDTMRELNALSAAVFGTPPYDFGSAPFSLESGGPILRGRFRTVEIKSMTDVLRVTDARDVMDYLCSFPPGDEADTPTLHNLLTRIAATMDAQGGVFPVTRIAGYMVARGPIR